MADKQRTAWWSKEVELAVTVAYKRQKLQVKSADAKEEYLKAKGWHVTK